MKPISNPDRWMHIYFYFTFYYSVSQLVSVWTLQYCMSCNPQSCDLCVCLFDPPGTNVCSESNGGCSHLCLPYPGGRSCRCAQDYLSVNKTKCVSNLKCPVGSKACRDGLKCVPVSKFCDQVPDCQDQSDEDCEWFRIQNYACPWFLTPKNT